MAAAMVANGMDIIYYLKMVGGQISLVPVSFP